MLTNKPSLFLLLAFALLSCKQSTDQLIDKAVDLSEHGNDRGATDVYSEIIKDKPKLELPYYNRGLCYKRLKDYSKALDDFNKIIANYPSSTIITFNKESPFATEEDKAHVGPFEALYQRAQVKYEMDSLRSSFLDFEKCANNEHEKCTSLLWLGTIWMRYDNTQKACVYFNMASNYRLNDVDSSEVERVLKAYCR